mgnify:CR=1 FL=1
MNFEKIYLVGNGRIADDCLRVLAERKIPVSYIQAEEEKFSFTEKLCERLGIPFLNIGRKMMKNFLMDIQEETLIFSVHNGYLFPKDVVEKENFTILNMHIAPLPLYRGMNAPTWEIYDQRDFAGVTWHEVVASIDAGRIIDQRTFPIEPDDTAMKVLQKSFRTGVELFKEHLDEFLDKSYQTKPLEGEKTRLYLGRELPNDGCMDLSWDFDKAYAFLRSMDYSGSNIMPLPRVIISDGGYKSYEITRYKKSVTDGALMEMPPLVECVDNNLKISWGGVQLKLRAA